MPLTIMSALRGTPWPLKASAKGRSVTATRRSSIGHAGNHLIILSPVWGMKAVGGAAALCLRSKVTGQRKAGLDESNTGAAGSRIRPSSVLTLARSFETVTHRQRVAQKGTGPIDPHVQRICTKPSSLINSASRGPNLFSGDIPFIPFSALSSAVQSHKARELVPSLPSVRTLRRGGRRGPHRQQVLGALWKPSISAIPLLLLFLSGSGDVHSSARLLCCSAALLLCCSVAGIDPTLPLLARLMTTAVGAARMEPWASSRH
ncbi:unnamed protein product [Ectocarpus sp. 12 AP-2014]